MFDAGVEILFVLADDHHIHLGCLVLTNGSYETGAHVGIETKRLADCDVETLKASTLRRGDWCFQKNFARRKESQELGSIPELFPARYTFSPISIVSISSAAPALFKNLECSGHDLRPNAVAVCDGNRDGA